MRIFGAANGTAYVNIRRTYHSIDSKCFTLENRRSYCFAHRYAVFSIWTGFAYGVRYDWLSNE
jgi:hypothetical protein